MTEDALALSDSVNKHYLDKVMDIAEERPVSATEDIFDARGTKLIAKGAIISRALEEKLIVHKLKKPLESSIALENGIDLNTIMKEAKRLADAIEPIGHILGATSRTALSPFDVLGNVRFGNAMSMMLTIAERGGPAALTHSVMVSLLSICLANKLGLSAKDQSTVAIAGLLHDIGELYIEPKYLQPGKRLLPHEWHHVIVHPRIGQMLILELENYPVAVGQAVAEHHERLDGTGYPSRLSGKSISVAGQVLSVAEMIAELLLQPDSPLERAELALKIIPNEHAYELISAITSALHAARQSVNRPVHAHSDDASERAKNLFEHITLIIETCQNMTELRQFHALKARELLIQTISRLETIQRAFSSTGLDSCPGEDIAQDREIMFEAVVATKEIQWRLRDVARDLAIRSSMLTKNETDAFRPLIALLDAEPDEILAMGNPSIEPRDTEKIVAGVTVS